ncbi:MAG: HAMP domain-containing histidine kinase [Muribaculaceae bacterium]|nr:HAMP domain-containing histidine kinase [Muribaculaceae bacterium]
MKKSTIWLLTILMALTVVGLLYIQIMYMESMIKMRDDQFTEGVRRSLHAVSSLLEQDETKYFLEEDVAQVEASSIYAQYGGAPHLGGIQYSFTTRSGLAAEVTLKADAEKIYKIQSDNNVANSYNSMRQGLKDQYLYQKGIIDDVIINIMNKAGNRPIEERADSSAVRRYLARELENNGLELPFEFALVNRSGKVFYQTAGFSNVNPATLDNSMFVQSLFRNDPASKKNLLKVYFPSKTKYIRSSVKFMMPSFVFTFILLIVFLYTIIVAFRQKKLTEMKNDFINNMTHEFKTPISTISLAAQMLNDDSVRKSPTMLQHISNVINDETKRLRFQVEKVLQMSMFDKKTGTLRLQDVDANLVISNVVNTFRLKVEKYGGKINARFDAEDAIVNVDEMHFTNVIFNLLDNAFKYRKEDEPLNLTVTTRNLPQERLEIVVADNGIGIRKENLKKIFEKFYRVSTGNRHDVKGFGLGLAYVYKMVTLMGGEIKAESELAKGSKFIIILPLLESAAEESDDEPENK